MNHKIIIADDDSDLVNELKEFLEGNGYEVHAASDGKKAFDLAVEIHPDLVILDIVMPEMDGFQVCKKLRENPSTSAVSIIMLASAGIGSEKIRGLELGADDYMEKPVQLDELKARIYSVLRRAEQLRDLSPLTNLPGNFRISNELAELVAGSGNKYAVYNIELDDFKSINDRYGSGRGDEVIKFLGALLSDILAHTEGQPAMLSHIGGSRFILITAPEHVENICQEIIAKYDAGIVNFYDEEAQEFGFIEIMNRKNEPVQHPICPVAIGVVSTEYREVRSQWEATATATEMCDHAKRLGKSGYEVDRRSTDDQFLAMLDGN